MKRVVASARETAKDPQQIEFIFYIDNDDTESQETAKALEVKTVIGPRITLSQMWNECYKIAVSDIYMHGGDDLIFRSPNWDELVLKTFEKYPDKIVFIHGPDGFFADNFGTHGFLHKNWVKTVNYFLPPYFSSDYSDMWLNDVANSLKRREYVPDLLIEHMHPALNKASWDQTYLERMARGNRDNVIKIYKDKKAERDENVQKLNKFIENSK